MKEFLIHSGKENVYASRWELRDWLDLVMRPWFAGRLLPVTEEIAERWGILTAEQRLRGRQITMPDGLIAATALEHGLIVATRNVKDFENLGVSILNPRAES